MAIKPTDVIKVLSVITGSQVLQLAPAIAKQKLAMALGKTVLSDNEIEKLIAEYYNGLEEQKQILLRLGADITKIEQKHTMAARWKYIAELTEKRTLHFPGQDLTSPLRLWEADSQNFTVSYKDGQKFSVPADQIVNFNQNC